MLFLRCGAACRPIEYGYALGAWRQQEAEGVAMHAVLITYRSAIAFDALVGPFTDHARAIAAVPGLVAKTWLRYGATLGGFYLFTGRAAADAYLDGALIADLAAHPAFAQFSIRHYGVLEELSRITGIPQPGAAARGDGPTGAAAASPGEGR